MSLHPLIKPAEHIESISEYYFSVKLAEVAKMNAEGKDVISLAVGAPDKMPSQQTIDTLCETARQPDVHAYQPYSGIPELRKAYADWYRNIRVWGSKKNGSCVRMGEIDCPCTKSLISSFDTVNPNFSV